MRDKRRFKRLDVELPVTLRLGGRLIPATTLNISSGGVCLGLDEQDLKLAEQGKVEVIIDLSQEQTDVSLRGEITRVETGEGKKIGIKFTNLYTVGHQTLEQFINKNLN